MKKISIVFLILLLAGGLLLNFSGETAAASEYNIRLSHQVPEDSPQDLYAQYFKEAIEDLTDGQITVDIYIANQLGAPISVLESLETGDIEMAVINTGSSASYIRELAIFNIHTLLPEDMSQVEEIFASRFITAMVEDIEADSNLKYVGAFSEPHFQITANRPIRYPEDLEGLDIRTMESPILMAPYQELGANPTPIAFDELYTSLQLGMVDAQENPYDIIRDMSYFEVQDYLITTYHGNPVNFAWISQPFFDQLSQDLQQAVMEAGQIAEEKTFAQIPIVAEESKERLIEEGMEVIEPDDSLREAFVEVRPYAEARYVDFVGERGVIYLDVLEEVIAELGFDS